MKSTIKVLVPLLVLAGIGVIIFTTQKSIDEMQSKSIDKHDFKAFVSQYAQDSIHSQSFNDARIQYGKLYDIITTEGNVMVSDGQSPNSPLLASTDMGTCYEEAFSAYFPVFRNYADNMFHSSHWSSGDRQLIKNEAENLRKRQGTARRSDSLSRYIQYINGYQACRNLIGRARSCGSHDSYRYVSNHIDDFRRYPYNNCSDLREIYSARQTAADAWRSSISRRVDNICSRSTAYYDYDSFRSDKSAIRDEISQYRSTIGSSWGDNELNRLDRKQNDW